MTQTVRDDSHSDYHASKAEAGRYMQRGAWANRFAERFVPLSSRKMQCDLPREAIEHISEGKHYVSYRGLPMAKDPLDLALYQMLLYELRPRIIIELGAYTGASALWMADMLRTYGFESEVWTVDIDLSLVDEAVRKEPRVKCLEGDCNHLEDLFPVELLRALPHPLILIDDAHVNIPGVYGHFHEHAFKRGDYLIIEDTIPWIPGTFGKSGEQEWGDWKWQEIRKFFESHEAEYRVDRYYADFFGYNATWNWNGFVKRV